MSQIDSSLKQHSLTLENIIRERIIQENDISFSEFMRMALYQPGLGYYSSGLFKFGKEGDFVTSPELGDLFAKTAAQQFKQIIEQVSNAVILELGAGTGQFCFDCLLELNNLEALPEKYYILEVSADLQQRQQHKLADLPEHLSKLVEWIQQPLTHKFNGVIFANEVLDALPVEVFKYENHKYQQMRVAWESGFVQKWKDFPGNLKKQLTDKNLSLESVYESEFTPHLTSWLQTIVASLNQGVVIFVDYGYERKSYYHSQRSQGTLVCFHQHQANFDYFSNVGLQDITAFVDFTAVAEAADACELSVGGYTTQAHFLMSLGIDKYLGDSVKNYQNYYKRSNEMKKLTLPHEMGEKFKVMALSKNLNQELNGFSIANQLHLL